MNESLSWNEWEYTPLLLPPWWRGSPSEQSRIPPVGCSLLEVHSPQPGNVDKIKHFKKSTFTFNQLPKSFFVFLLVFLVIFWLYVLFAAHVLKVFLFSPISPWFTQSLPDPLFTSHKAAFFKYCIPRTGKKKVWSSGPQLQVEGPSFLLTLSFASFMRSLTLWDDQNHHVHVDDGLSGSEDRSLFIVIVTSSSQPSITEALSVSKCLIQIFCDGRRCAGIVHASYCSWIKTGKNSIK